MVRQGTKLKVSADTSNGQALKMWTWYSSDLELELSDLGSVEDQREFLQLSVNRLILIVAEF